MRKHLLLIWLIGCAAVAVRAQGLYVKVFGPKDGVPLVFLHGGPGYNAAMFESVAAQTLADSGFRVLVYDRRGEGRSVSTPAHYTFAEALGDLDSLCRTCDLRRPILLGHSFGGMLALLYADKYPDRVQSVVLVGAPVALQETFGNIRARCRALYEERADSLNLKYIDMLGAMDKSSLEYASYCFMHAMANGFYTPKNPSKEGLAVRDEFKADSALSRVSQEPNWQAPQGFHRSEHYTMLDLTDTLRRIIARGTPVYGLYGAEDGLYSAAQLETLRHILSPERMLTLDSCSHNVFLDRRRAFVDAVTRWCRVPDER